MIIKDFQRTKTEFKEDGTFEFEHTQLLDPTLEYVQRMRENQISGGFTANRDQRYIGTIPECFYLKHREEWKNDPDKMLAWFDTEEGKPYRVNQVDTGKSGKVIVK